MKLDKYMGLDVHQAMTVAVVLDAEGKVFVDIPLSKNRSTGSREFF